MRKLGRPEASGRGGMLGRGSINRAGLVIGKGDQDLLVYRKAVKRRCGDQITERSEKTR